jgi:hypothetical protein
MNRTYGIDAAGKKMIVNLCRCARQQSVYLEQRGKPADLLSGVGRSLGRSLRR